MIIAIDFIGFVILKVSFILFLLALFLYESAQPRAERTELVDHFDNIKALISEGSPEVFVYLLGEFLYFHIIEAIKKACFVELPDNGLPQAFSLVNMI